MASDLQFSITGLEPLLAKLEGVSYDMKRKGGRFALRKAAQIVENALKQNAERVDDPETGRSIPANVALRWSGRLFKRTGNLGFRVGIRHGAVLKNGGSTKANAPTPHWRLLEFGTEKMAAKPFARAALESNIGAATNEFISQYQKALDRAIKKAAKGK